MTLKTNTPLPLEKWGEYERLKPRLRQREGMVVSEADLKRFWNKVNVMGDNDCWNWIPITRTRPRFNIFEVCLTASRFSAYMHGLYIPNGWDCCHHCDNSKCCNPRHLFAGTRAHNMQDCSRKGRIKLPNTVGEKNAASKLTEPDVTAIISMREAKRPFKIIADIYGVSIGTIESIAYGRTWKHHVREVID